MSSHPYITEPQPLTRSTYPQPPAGFLLAHLCLYVTGGEVRAVVPCSDQHWDGSALVQCLALGRHLGRSLSCLHGSHQPQFSPNPQCPGPDLRSLCIQGTPYLHPSSYAPNLLSPLGCR